MEDATPPLMNQASTSSVSPHITVTNAQPNIDTQQKQNASNKKPNGPSTDPSHVSILIFSKATTKPTCTPLNIVEKMKKTNVSIPMWNVFTIPS